MGGANVKISEMEKNNYVSYGLPALIKNMFFNHSDGFNPYVCK
jgi:hypothetical protein